MKKIIALLTVLCMMLAMTGCLGEDLMTKYENAVKKTNELRQLDMDIKFSISQEASESGGSSYALDMPINMNIKAKLNDDDLIDSMSMTMSANILSEDIRMSIIYVDEVTYASVNSTSIEEQKIKIEGNINEMTDFAYDVSVEEMSSVFMMQDFIDEDILEESEVEKSDGNTTIKLELSAAKMTELLESMMEQFSFVTDSMGGDSIFGDDSSFKITDSDVKLVIDKNGYLSKTNFNISSEIKVLNVVSKSEIKIRQTINSPGEDVKIKAPSDKDSYQSYGSYDDMYKNAYGDYL